MIDIERLRALIKLRRDHPGRTERDDTLTALEEYRALRELPAEMESATYRPETHWQRIAERERARADAAELALGHLRGSISGVMTCQRCRHYPCEIPARWCGKCLDAAHAARIAAEQRAERAVAAIERALNENTAPFGGNPD